ncbi:unnamed protein product [Heligmosomoides polygyrus]|uniref:Uncharacterized protein n=1 Tax=Heligmosomoides polygyrus TaxID=6339 RepID=A0A183G7D7_HELPZ|nr:unnamed protein product [Heligmosomoides polygyrus]
MDMEDSVVEDTEAQVMGDTEDSTVEDMEDQAMGDMEDQAMGDMEALAVTATTTANKPPPESFGELHSMYKLLKLHAVNSERTDEMCGGLAFQQK